ncbi:hypothetical protein M9H77_21386 [Catharanthus roseus]|uniref:Uncharacterized protein n=1 Tax=Catharanthus roseus TaxID=4058 RepID=A0ACC0ARI9_CATRO|nr:hypothetical protein M9H77_21386 [Catharanthus roseus]
MEDKKSHHLLQPLIPSAADQNSISAALSNSGIIFRFFFIICIGLISIWADHEASKGHSITIINEASHTTSGRRFDLFYASNDKASRIIYRTSKFAEKFLYPDSTYPKKQVNHVILRLSSRTMTQSVVVDSPPAGNGEYVIYISPSIMDEINHKQALFLAIQRGMARIWLWDIYIIDEIEVPLSIVNGIVEYITDLAVGEIKSSQETMAAAADGCWRSKKNTKAAEEFLSYYEMKNPGFIRQLNRELRHNGWDDRMVDVALGLSIQHLCAHTNSSSSSSSV